MSEVWKNVWLVPDERHAWRTRLDHLKGDEFLGTKIWPTKESAEAKGKKDEAYFVGELGMSVSYLRAEQIDVIEQDQ